tara:strand:+ start:373 stop:579 length:207 start_codon:yes stop_codon:yes gene_type:complete
MWEFLKHATGLCGEPHPSLLTILINIPIIGYLIIKIKNINMKEMICKLLCKITSKKVCLNLCVTKCCK